MSTERQLKKDIQHLKSDLGSLMKHIEEVSESKVTKIGVSAEEAKDLTEEKLKYLIKEMESLLSRVTDGLKETEKKVEATIHDHPISSVLAAAGIGFLVGKFLDLGRR